MAAPCWTSRDWRDPGLQPMQMGMSNTPPSGDSLRGLILATATYVLWGFLPLFMKELAHVPPS